MNMINLNDLVVKESDYERLLGLIEKSASEIARQLEDELSRAEVVDDNCYPGDAVCMGSKVEFVDLNTDKKSELILVYPRQASVDDMRVSILTPMGSALIGMRIGGVIDWVLPNGKTARIKILSIRSNKEE
jgi:regulator of nucleoside diphosphate kinase